MRSNDQLPSTFTNHKLQSLDELGYHRYMDMQVRFVDQNYPSLAEEGDGVCDQEEYLPLTRGKVLDRMSVSYAEIGGPFGYESPMFTEAGYPLVPVAEGEIYQL